MLHWFFIKLPQGVTRHQIHCSRNNRRARFQNGNTQQTPSQLHRKDQGRKSYFYLQACSAHCRQDMTQMAQLQPGWAAAARGWWSRLHCVNQDYFMFYPTILKVIGNLSWVVKSSKVNSGLWKRAAGPAVAQHSSWCTIQLHSLSITNFTILHFPGYFSQWT